MRVFKVAAAIMLVIQAVVELGAQAGWWSLTRGEIVQHCNWITLALTILPDNWINREILVWPRGEIEEDQDDPTNMNVRESVV